MRYAMKFRHKSFAPGRCLCVKPDIQGGRALHCSISISRYARATVLLITYYLIMQGDICIAVQKRDYTVNLIDLHHTLYEDELSSCLNP
jgi:hypothetical protein